jgi:PilZ domain
MSNGAAASAAPIGRTLLVSQDSAIIAELTEWMGRFAISTEVCADVGIAFGLLNHRKFEAVIVDLKLGEQSSALLEKVRLSPANRTAVTFAITDSGGQVPKSEATNFVMERPLSPSSVERMLRAAYGMIVRERRRYFRCPVKIPAEILGNGAEVYCQTMNISEGGLAVSTSVPLKPGARVGVQFTLPDQLIEFIPKSEISWYDERSRAGLQFMALASNLQSELNGWLARRLEESLPESVTSKFRKAGD